MAKFKLKALNVVIGGKLYRKEQDFIFDTAKMKAVEKEIVAASEKGFLEEVKEPKKDKK